MKACAEKQGKQLTIDEARRHLLMFSYPEITSYLLQKEYVEMGVSTYELSKRFNCAYDDIIHFLDMFGIEKRGLSEARTEHSCKKRRKTCLENWGVENPSQASEIKEKKRKTCLKNWGVDNYRKSKEFKVWLDDFMLATYGQLRVTNGKKISKKRREFSTEKWKKIHQKFRETCRQRHGVSNPCALTSNPSKLELRIGKALLEMGLAIETQKEIKHLFFDFWIKDTDILIEVNGDFWHANPVLYKKNDELNFPGNKKIASDLWKKDMRKKARATNAGFQTVYLWETDINACNDEESVIQLILMEIANEYSKNQINQKDFEQVKAV